MRVCVCVSVCVCVWVHGCACECVSECLMCIPLLVSACVSVRLFWAIQALMYVCACMRIYLRQCQ